MHDPVLTVNPTVKIFHPRGKFVAGWLMMHRPFVAVNEADLVLFDVLTKACAVSDAERLAAEALDRMLGIPVAPADITNQIRELSKAKFFVAPDGPPENSENLSPRRMISDCRAESMDTTLDRDRELRVTKNFLARPTGEGFAVWSPVTESYHVFGIELFVLLSSFGSETNVSRVINNRSLLGDRQDLYAAIDWLVRNRFLFEVDRRYQEPPSTPTGSDRNRDGNAMTRSRGIMPVTLPDAAGRTPIYFVPHTSDHFPLALGMLYSFIQSYKEGLLLDRYFLVPIIYMDPEEILGDLYEQYGEGIWLFSNYMWSVEKNLSISAAVKSRNPLNLTIHGGPSTPNYPAACAEFLETHRSVDIAVHGEGEQTLAELLEAMTSLTYDVDSMGKVNGISFRGRSSEEARGGLVTTMPRARFKEPDAIPSPYLGGAFDLYGEVSAAIIESNRGCPFGCTFCDWGSATQQKVRKFDLQRVRDEISWLAAREIRVLWIADANFGMYDRDIEIAEWISETKKRRGFPREVVVNYTKNATKRLSRIIEVFAQSGICSQGIISIQTRDESTLDVINRRNIKTEKYNELAEIFRDQNLPLSTDLMIGLPGITVDAFKKDLQYYFDKDVEVKAYLTQLLPNSPMADPAYIEKYEIEVDENDYLASCFSYTRSDLREMKELYNLFSLADSYSVLRYVLRYLQWEKGVTALEFLHRLLQETNAVPDKWPTITFWIQTFSTLKIVPGGWRCLYDEIADFAQEVFGCGRDSAFNAVLRFNELVMPDDSVPYPLEVRLEHDIISYFDARQEANQRSAALGTYPATTTVIDDKYKISHIDFNAAQYDSHQTFWELRTSVSRVQSEPNFY